MGCLILKKEALFFVLTLVLAVIFDGVASAAGLADSPWSKYQHDQENSGQSQYQGPQTNTVKWKFKSSAVSPVLSKYGAVYFGTGKYVYAVTKMGTLKWKYKTGGSVSSVTVGSDGTLYIGSDKLYALNSDGSKIKWSYSAGNVNLLKETYLIMKF